MVHAQVTKEELLEKAKKPAEDAMRLHAFYRGKMQTALRCQVRDLPDFAIWYTPGVAAPCRAIAQDPNLVYELTSKWNTVAVISDGTRVLGLGDIGPKAGLPVMEGKALLYKYLGGVDAYPIMLDTKDPDKIIETVLMLQPALGGVNLEDISQPKCFRILDTLREHAEIPVWHDDQQGTASVVLSAMINAAKIVGKRLEDMRIAFLGAGAANVACTRLLFAYGVDPSNCIMTDINGILGKHRRDFYLRRAEFVQQWHLCQITNHEELEGDVEVALRGADAMIGFSAPGPGVVKPEWIKQMAKDAIVLAGANPIPEIWPWEAAEAGAAVVATGRSDFPNQVNNSLGFPGIFRGALDVRARTITDEMAIAASETLARMAEEKGLSPDHLLPTMDEWEIFPREAAAVAVKAVEQGVARLTTTYDEEYERASEMIRQAREMTHLLMREGFIVEGPEGDDASR
ncbi:MAG: NADP-dependent malic enzyme [Anaerolineae bacterium]|nr:NADP-dependent malic enzyme [Anaerolineae bacterium]MEB2286701.1 NADP-dependent malic enzyme [Anaerolineae bacterium]